MTRIDLNWQELTRIDKNWSELTRIDQIWPEMTRNDQKCLEMSNFLPGEALSAGSVLITWFFMSSPSLLLLLFSVLMLWWSICWDWPRDTGTDTWVTVVVTGTDDSPFTARFCLTLSGRTELTAAWAAACAWAAWAAWVAWATAAIDTNFGCAWDWGDCSNLCAKRWCGCCIAGLPGSAVSM